MKTKSKHNKRSSLEDVDVPVPIQVKFEPKSETYMPAPVKVKKEKHKHASQEEDDGTLIPTPIKVKMEKIKKNKKRKAESSDDENAENSDTFMPCPIKVKRESRNRPTSESSEADSTSDEEEQTAKPVSSPQSDVSDALNGSVRASDWERKLFEACPGITECSGTAEPLQPESQEFFLLKCPKTVDPRVLENLNFKIDGNTKFKLPDTKNKFVIKAVKEDPKSVTVFSSELQHVDVKKTFVIERQIKNSNELNVEVPERVDMPLPSNLKTRHSLFGVEYKKLIKIKKNVKLKLEEADKNARKQSRKAMKKKGKRKDHSDMNNEEIFDILNFTSFS